MGGSGVREATLRRPEGAGRGRPGYTLLGTYRLQRGKAKLRIDEVLCRGDIMWVVRPGPLYAYEILPPEIAEHDRMVDGMALLHDAQEWLSRRRQAIAEERGRIGEKELREPHWARKMLADLGYTETALDDGKTYEQRKGSRYDGSKRTNVIFA